VGNKKPLNRAGLKLRLKQRKEKEVRKQQDLVGKEGLPLRYKKVNGAIQDRDGQCFLLIIYKEYDLVYLAALLALSTISD
jgi:hypothetical protein